jgi:hypothetical protein
LPEFGVPFTVVQEYVPDPCPPEATICTGTPAAEGCGVIMVIVGGVDEAPEAPTFSVTGIETEFKALLVGKEIPVMVTVPV